MDLSHKEAAELLQQDQVVAIPTETVFGLAASFHSQKGVEAIFSLKKRPPENPLIIHVQNKEECLPFMKEVPPFFNDLADSFWPGPLTLVVPIIEEKVPSYIRAGLPMAAFRAPSHPDTQKLLSLISPLVAPSANLSGKPSATRKEHIAHDFGPSFPVLSSKEGAQGLESTILLFKEGRWVLGRRGALDCTQLEQVLEYAIDSCEKVSRPLCPGQLFRHYAPDAKVILTEQPQGPYVIGFKEQNYPQAEKVFLLGSIENPQEAALHLYDLLRQVDLEELPSVEIDLSFPEAGLWKTILDRLRKATSQ